MRVPCGAISPRPGSDVVVFYSGHGVPGLKDRRGYLLPVDANPNTAEINGYPIDVLYANLSQLEEAKSVQVYLDACFSGDSHSGMLIRGVSGRADNPAAATGPDGWWHDGFDGGHRRSGGELGTRLQSTVCLPTTCWRRCTARVMRTGTGG